MIINSGHVIKYCEVNQFLPNKPWIWRSPVYNITPASHQYWLHIFLNQFFWQPLSHFEVYTELPVQLLLLHILPQKT